MLLDEMWFVTPFRTEPQHGRFTHSAYTHFLPDKNEKEEEKAEVKSASVSGDTQRLFRKSPGLCVFALSFSEPQTPCQMGSRGEGG